MVTLCKKVQKMQKSYPKKTKIISTFLEHPRETLTALTLLNTTANFGVAFLALWMTLKREFAQFPFIIISLLILIIGCEIIPKTFAMRHPDRWALRVAPVLQILKNISTPIHFLVRLATRNHAKNNLQNKNPNTSSKIMVIGKQGENVQVLKIQDSWFFVRYIAKNKSIYGYVPMQALRIIAKS